MFRRRLLVLALATMMGLITSYVVYKAVTTSKAQAAQTEQIVVAGVSVGLGEALTPQHVKMAPWPKAALPPGFLRSAKEAEGRLAKASMVVGEPVLDSKLAPPGQGGLMPVLIPAGKRAVTIKVDEAVQRSGFVVPNSRVDVLVTMARKAGENRETRIVLQDVIVLASDQIVEMKDNKPVTMTTATMALSPEETERLALAQNEGKVTLALRNLNDTSRVSTSGVTIAQLMGGAPPPATQHAAAATEGKGPAPTARRGVKRVSQSGRMAALPPPQSPPRPQTLTVSVIRGVTLTNLVFIKDPDRGWIEASVTSEGAPKSN